MLWLDVRRINTAIRAGRLEHAAALLDQPRLLKHQQGQRLIDTLGQAWLNRADQQLQQGCIDQARRDCREAARWLGRQPKVAAMAQRIEQTDPTRKPQHESRQVLARCQRQVDPAERQVDPAKPQIDAAKPQIDAAEMNRCRPYGLNRPARSRHHWARLTQQALHQLSASSSGKQPMPLPDDRQRVGHLPARSTGGTRHLLSVSGVGTILIITQDRLTLGPVSPRDAQQPAPDLALVTDPLTAPATICRDEEAYLLQHRDRTRLLTHGDRIDMGPRCSVKFRQPHPASATALLDLQAARVLDRPMRLVAMVQRELILGPGSQAHVVSRDVDGQIILVHRQGAWTLRSSDGRTHQPLEPGRAVHVRGVDLCLDPSTGNPSPESNVS